MKLPKFRLKKHPNPPSPKKAAFYGVIMIVLALIGRELPSHLSVALTPSMDHRVYWLVRGVSPESVQKNDLIMFKMTTPLLQGMSTDIAIKRVSCVAGEHVRVEQRDIYCEDEFLGTAKQVSKKGTPLPVTEFRGEVPTGKLMVSAPHRDSLDSRYFGPIGRDEIIALAYPVFSVDTWVHLAGRAL